MVYNLSFFFIKNAVCFIILTYLVPVLFTFYIQGVLKLKNNSGAKRLIHPQTAVSLLADCPRQLINPLTPNDHNSGRTAPLTSKVTFYIFIQQI